MEGSLTQGGSQAIPLLPQLHGLWEEYSFFWHLDLNGFRHMLANMDRGINEAIVVARRKAGCEEVWSGCLLSG